MLATSFPTLSDTAIRYMVAVPLGMQLASSMQRNSVLARTCEVEIDLFGPLLVIGPNGEKLTPRSQKAKAVLALLALSEHGTRSRSWICEKLWSESPSHQAFANLRQTLTEVRKALGSYSERVVSTDKFTISLQMDSVRVDALQFRQRAEVGNSQIDNVPDNDLLEGIDVHDEEFEDWLTAERSYWNDMRDRIVGRIAEQRARGERPQPATATPMSLVVVRPDVRDERAAVGPLDPLTVEIAEPLLLPQDERSLLAASRIIGCVASHFRDSFSIVFTGGRVGEASGLGLGFPDHTAQYSVRTRILRSGDDLRLNFVVYDLASRSVIWTKECGVDQRALFNGIDAELASTVELMAEMIQMRAQLESITDGVARRLPDLLAHSAATRMFQLSKDDLDIAEAKLRQSLHLKRSGSTSAWLVFLLTFRLGQRFLRTRSAALDEMRSLMRQALALDPYNARTLSLVAHAEGYAFGEYDRAIDLFERAIRLNPGHALTWDLYSVLHGYIGRAAAGFRCAQLARQIGYYSSNRYYYDTSCCITAALSGQYEEALRYGGAALEVRPQFNSALRYMIASHGNLGNRAEAGIYIDRLRAVEPDFSIEALRESHYPGLVTVGGAAFVSGLLRAGVPVSI